MIQGFVEFEFDLPEALLSSLVTLFGAMASAPLVPENVRNIPEAQGVYMLSLRDEIVYLGKTDAEAGLKRRLERHAWTIQHRVNLSAGDVTFKAVRVFVFTAMDLETQLLRYYAPVPWNNSGFGSNDPGRRRDETELKPEGFDAQFPINLDHEVAVSWEGGATTLSVLTALRRHLPYVLRIESAARGQRSPHSEIAESIMTSLPSPPITTRKIMECIVGSLPQGWQATALPGRIILYKERKNYSAGTIIAQS